MRFEGEARGYKIYANMNIFIKLSEVCSIHN